MSIVTLKNKSKSLYGGSTISGQNPGGYFMNQGPFGNSNKTLLLYSSSGFSINGGTRNKGYIGQNMGMSKNGTSFNGTIQRGAGGKYGKYYNRNPVFNRTGLNTLNTQSNYIKPSVLSNKGMISKKYRWIHSGQYPNSVVQNTYSGNLVENSSQGNYIKDLTNSGMRPTIYGKDGKIICDATYDINNVDKFVGYKACGSATGCQTTTAGRKYNQMASNGAYTKTVKKTLDASQYTQITQYKCANQTEKQKPFPNRVNGNGCNNILI
jgi:hypothetical protein